MMSLNIYSLMHKETKVLGNFWLSYDDKEASSYMLNMLIDSYDSLKENDKEAMKSNIQNSVIVRVGSIDLLSHEMKNDFNILVDLKDFEEQIIMKGKNKDEM